MGRRGGECVDRCLTLANQSPLNTTIKKATGDDAAADVNSFQLQYTINYKLGNGYYITSSPLITANWEAESGNQWAVPFGGGLGRMFKVDNQAVAVDVGAYYYAERPEYHPDWYVQILVNFLFPKI